MMGVKIYIGLMTGYNKAFLIDEKTKKELIKEDPKSEELIKPLLRGRDIHKYSIEWNKEWLIVIPSGFTKNLVGEELTEKEAEELFKKEFPLLYNHLSKFINKLKKRWNRGEFWWELRPCDYYQEFEKPKIVWQRVSKEPVFILDIAGMIVLDSTFFVTGDYELLKFLIVVLSSRFIEDYYLKNFAYVLSDGYLMSKQYIEKIPIRLPENSRPFSIIADYLLFLNAIKDRREEYKEVIEFFDKQIADSLVYELYFKEKFYEDGLYQEDKALFLEAVEKYLKKIDYDSWAKLYWKEQLEGKLSKQEQRKMKELEQENLKTILEVYNVLKSSQKVSELVSKIKSHKWVRRLEDEC